MKILMIGDVVGNHGTFFLAERLPALKRKLGAELTIVNAENSAEGNGVLPASADRIFAAGADIITLGNHALRRREIYSYLDEHEDICRPANFHTTAAGHGYCTYDCPGKPKVTVINLCGTCYMDTAHENPFDKVNEILEQIDSRVVLVDFHAEATSEKLCMGFMLDGKVSAVLGTHTHIQTADHRVLPNGTGYMTDIGMCGSFNSVLGVKPELALNRFLTNLPTRFENDTGAVRMSGVLLTIDNATGKCIDIVPINEE